MSPTGRSRRGPGQTLIQASRRKSPEEKAVYHNLSGAGRSRVRREFFDLNEMDLEVIRKELDTRLDANLRRT